MDPYLSKFIIASLKEDIGSGDYTSIACIPDSTKGKAHLLVKENGILAGVELAKNIFHKVDGKLKMKIFIPDGSIVKKNEVAFIVEGKVQSILKAERLVLNCMQRMSGIATATNKLVQLCQGTRAQVLDTRKTTPGFRAMEKWAVKIGGGQNHRWGLYDMILIKDNHIDYAGGIKKAIEQANFYLKKNKKNLKIEIEARNLKEVNEIISLGGVDRILLDNFSIADLKKAVLLIKDKFQTEASGGINEGNIRSYAKCNIDYISIGAITHSAKSIDLSLKAIK